MTTSTKTKPADARKLHPEPAVPVEVSPENVRKSAGLSQNQMADLLGMSEFGYAQWEAGSRKPGGPAYRLLHLISRDGQTVIDALRTIKV